MFYFYIIMIHLNILIPNGPSQFDRARIFVACSVEPMHQQVVQKALAAIGHSGSLEVKIKPLSGGRSGDPLYHLFLGSDEYVLRIVRHNVKAFAASTQFASDHGFGPKLIYTDSDSNALLMEFIRGVPLRMEHLENPEMIQQFADHLKTIHQNSQWLPPFDQFDKIHSGLKMNQKHYSDLNLDEISQKVEEIERLIAQCHFSQSPCHNDLHPGNLFYDVDGNIKIIDWGDTGLGDPLFDLARISIEFQFDAEQTTLFLHRYFERPPEDLEKAHFYLMQQVIIVQTGFALLDQKGPIHELVARNLDRAAKKEMLIIPADSNFEFPIDSKEAARWIFDTCLENTRSDTFALAVMRIQCVHVSREPK